MWERSPWVPKGKEAFVLLGRLCQPGRSRGQGSDVRWLFPRRKTTAAQCTGQHRVAPGPGRKPGTAFVCHALCAYCVRPLTLFACRMDPVLVAISYSPFPPPSPMSSSPPRRPLWSYTGTPQLPIGESGSVRSETPDQRKRSVVRSRTSYPSDPYRYKSKVCW